MRLESNKIVIIILGFVPHDGSVWLGVVREKKRGRESRMESGTGRERGRDRPITVNMLLGRCPASAKFWGGIMAEQP